ncbi:hypothetical protein [Sphingomonas sp.]|uniref:hypothetical protein n=1 Tax=Sphingomonas sp. TaxID=28214 RepID=UPI00286E0A47|nr:hypothetical protein [Sphingomonas sp.]
MEFPFETFAPVAAIIGICAVVGWVITTWLRVKHGYPLESSWGIPIHPSSDKESIERIKLLTGENAQLRAELGAVKDRLETIERIVTDQPSRLAREIDSLTFDKGGNA